MVIFGASGDLTRRKLAPSLYMLYRKGLLSSRFFVMGASRSNMDDSSFRALLEPEAADVEGFDRRSWLEFAKRLYYTPVDFNDAGSYARLGKAIEDKEAGRLTGGNRIFYLATPPSAYLGITGGLSSTGLAATTGWTRLVVEKPYGTDLRSALELNASVQRGFREDQVFRIDHYLGKETVQNILMLRFANSIFEPVWNRRYIDHIQITAAETIGVEKRAGYYEQAGVLRDMFQNHLLQLLTLAAMEPPSVYEPSLAMDERVKILRALRPVTVETAKDSVVLGQYAAGGIGGAGVPAYRDEDGVDKGSRVATYAALKLYVDNWRWQGVPFYLRSGKRMQGAFSQVTIQFKGVPHLMFRGSIEGEIAPNALILRIQPDERVQIKFHTKSPGTRACLRDVVMDFPYAEGYEGYMPGAYERVLLDCMHGDKMLFIRSDGMELSWAFLQPLLELMDAGGPQCPPLNPYVAGSWGPEESDAFIGKDRRGWVNYVRR
jgi:glucose-6-phosphate 1-dehydrogenase